MSYIPSCGDYCLVATTPNKASVTTTQAKTSFRLEQNYPVSKLTTFGIGGLADWVAFCRSADEVVEAVEFCRENRLEYVVIGGGSNILASDKGFRGLIIVLQIETLEMDDDCVTVGAGYSLHRLVEKTIAAGLEGLESLAGIAGTVGGAIVGNAGAYGVATSDYLIDVNLYHPLKGFFVEAKENLGYQYRHSNLKWSQNIVISGRFRLAHGDATCLTEKMNTILAERWQKHPKDNISAGCFFKNVESATASHGKIAAGYLLDQIGAKQMQIGHAGVFSGHANILINKGGATASDVRDLSIRLKEKVKEIYGIDLTEEVIFLGDFS
jgi:UDP-N-acetylmuramate dehydrogenase